ncbi:MAG: hypothetical protein QM820_60395 [Minicystis sp.]
MTEGRRTRLALALLAALSLWPQAARAGTPEDEKKSRQFFAEADALASQGRWKDACFLFQSAHDLNATNGTAYRTAECYERIDEYERAARLYQYVIDHAATDKVPERPILAQNHLQEIEKKIAARQAPVGQRRVDQVPPPLPPPKPNRVPAIVLLSVGGAGAVLGAVFGGMALSQASQVKSACPTPCTPQNPDYNNLKSQFDASVTKAHVSTAGIVVGAVGLAAGTVLWVLGVPKAAGTVKRTVGPGGLSLQF